ncbi:phosphonate C-P lyase system protein PhnG [Roseomonas alba]|nr:phosphonate C-P lyase system protein PhnG [Neoroseomonas alba]
MTQTATNPDPERRHWMAVLARAGAAEITDLLAPLPALPAFEHLRPPETGLVMVRGRAGGDGAPFNLGEMTVTRCAVRLGEAVGHAYVAGRDKVQAELAALLDAALQDPARRDALMDSVIAPLAARQQAAREAEARRAAATKVDFLAMQTIR